MLRPAFRSTDETLLDHEKMEAVGFEVHVIGKKALKDGDPTTNP